MIEKFGWLLLMVPTLVVLVRVVCVASKLSRKAWSGHQWEFVGLSLSYSLVAGGALAVCMYWHDGSALLLYGVAGWILFDRRNKLNG